ncbi:hypothetical protein TURU_145714 [Turdus rufiventris]|nr:hypothetical protein TURU_145714 [Turdus rufiventris]
MSSGPALTLKSREAKGLSKANPWSLLRLATELKGWCASDSKARPWTNGVTKTWDYKERKKREGLSKESNCRGRKGEEKLEFLGTPVVGDQLEKMVQKGLLKVCVRKCQVRENQKKNLGNLRSQVSFSEGNKHNLEGYILGTILSNETLHKALEELFPKGRQERQLQSTTENLIPKANYSPSRATHKSLVSDLPNAISSLISSVNGPPHKRMLDHDSKPAFTESGIWAAMEPPEAYEQQKSLMEDRNQQAE